MRIATITICCIATLALAGCSKPGKQGGTGSISTTPEGQTATVDYHSLISYRVGNPERYVNDPNYPAFKHAQMKCAEAGENLEDNAWCDAVYKAKVCGDASARGDRNGRQWAVYVEQHPSVACPPK